MKEFITDLGVIPNASSLMTLFCDNAGAIALAKEPTDIHVLTKNCTRETWSIRRPLIHYLRPKNMYGYGGV